MFYFWTSWCIMFLVLLGSCREEETDLFSPLFDGSTFKGWEGDTLQTWRIENGAIIGGSLVNDVPKNNFLCTENSYEDFVLKLKIKLEGNEGFINSGIQFRSERLDDPAHEMIGYQADFGENFWVSLYDESRRNKTLIAPDSLKVLDWIKQNDWNDYVIRAEGKRIRLYINGNQTVDYVEPEQSIPQSGIIGIQIHGGGKALVSVKDIFIQEL